MNAKKLLRIGDISLAFAMVAAFTMVAAVAGALSLMSVDSMAFAKNGSDDGGSSGSSSDDRGGDDNGGDRSGSSNDDDSRDDNGGDRKGRSNDDDDRYDDHGRRHGGHGADDGMYGAGGTYLLPDLAAIVSDFEGRGFRVLDIKREDGAVVEIEVIDPAGAHLEMYFNTATNTVLSQHLED
jgi:hypothetical protein